MEEQIEQWELCSGKWLHDRASDTWRLSAIRDGTAVDPRLPAQDVARLVGAHREPATGDWVPPDFSYSQRTGERLRVTIPTVDFPWVPPFGTSALPGTKPLARDSRQTPRPLALARAHERSPDGAPDSTLPPLPPGQYRFVVDKFGLASPSLVAVEPERGNLFVLLPESKSWIALKRASGASWGQRLRNPRGWRMELVHAQGYSTAYCPSATGLVAITPNPIALSYAIEHAGDGPAIGGPVAWGGEIWSPVLGKGHVVQLVGKPHGAAGHIVVPTSAPAPQHGFEAPAFDDLQVIWPCDEGQLVLRLDAHGGKRCEWIAWPAQVTPLFTMGWQYHPRAGSFWQLCRRNDDGRFGYVQMASTSPELVATDALHLCTGRTCYRGASRIDGDPWRAAKDVDPPSTQVVVPMLESTYEGALIGLRMEAPNGMPGVLQADDEPLRAVLQVDVQGRHTVKFGTLEVKKPWLTQLFVHDGHLWADHPDLPQAIGWKLGL